MNFRGGGVRAALERRDQAAGRDSSKH